MIDYILLPPVGTDGLCRQGTVADLVRETPYLIYLNVIPPLHILNQVLETGREDAGMSGGAEWQPFQVTLEEHATLVQELENYPQREYHYVPPPSEITNFEEWWHWVLEQREKK